MPFIPVPNAARVCVKYSIYQQDVCNIWWFEMPTLPSVADLLALGTAINSFVVGEIMPHMSNSLVYTGCTVRSMTTASSPQVDVPTLTGVPGGVAQESPPSNVALAVKFLTQFAGRSFRGRSFMVGIPENQILGNFVGSAFRDQLTTGFLDLATYLAATAWDHIVASLYSGVDANGDPIPRATGVTTEVINYAADLIVDSQRRRLTGRGN